MNPRVRVAALCTAVSVGVLTVLPGTSVAAVGKLSPAGDQAFTRLAGCIASGDHSGLDALFVVDESLSLRQTDPDSRRTQALEAAVASLRDLDRSLKPLGKSVHLAGATFATGYQQRLPWSRSDSPAVDSFVDSVSGLNSGEGTDYVAALSGARSSFRDRGDACKAVFWFTDGKLDVGDDAANEDAWQSLLKQGGLPDSMRNDQIALVALPLFSSSAPKELAASDEDKARLQALAEGTGRSGKATATAGKLVDGAIPEGYQGGAYLESADPSVLSLYFSEAVARASGYGEAQLVRCPTKADCPGGRLPVQVDPGVGHTRVLITSETGLGALTVIPPEGGNPVPVQPGVPATGKVGGVSFEVSWASGLAKVDLDLPGGTAGTGLWAVQLDPKRPAQALVFRRSGLQVELDKDHPPLIVGEPTQLGIQVSTPDGQPVPADLYKSLDVSAGLGDDKEQAVQLSSEGMYTFNVTPSGESGPTTLSTTVSATTVTGIRLEPVTPSFPLSVVPPGNFPRVKSLTFPDVEGTASVTGELVIQGGDKGQTKVRLDDIELTGPDGATSSSLSGISAGQVVELQPGQVQTIPVTFTPVDGADGLATGELRVTLASADAAEQLIEQVVPFDITMARPVNESVRWGLVALFVLISLLFPFILLWLAGRTGARFGLKPEVSRSTSFDAVLTERGIQRRDGRRPTIAGDDLDYGVMVAPGRRTASASGVQLKARARPPLFEPIGSAFVSSGLVVSPQSPYLEGDGSSVWVPLGIGVTWLMLVDDASVNAWASRAREAYKANAVISELDVRVLTIVGAEESVADVAETLDRFGAGRDALLAILAATPEIAAPTEDSPDDGPPPANYRKTSAEPDDLPPPPPKAW